MYGSCLDRATRVLLVGIVAVGMLIPRAPRADPLRGASSVMGEATDVMLLAVAIKQLHPDHHYAGIDAATLVKAGKVPDATVRGSTIVNSWGGQITIDAASHGGGSDNAFRLTVTEVPTEACTGLVMAVRDAFQLVTVGAGMDIVVKDDSLGPAAVLDGDAVAEVCARAAKHTLSFTAN